MSNVLVRESMDIRIIIQEYTVIDVDETIAKRPCINDKGCENDNHRE